jgi:hypothetical protein
MIVSLALNSFVIRQASYKTMLHILSTGSVLNKPLSCHIGFNILYACVLQRFEF